MGEKKKTFWKNGTLLIVFLLSSFACSLGFKIKKDVFYETFFSKARFIITDEELKVYKHLHDAESKEEFIDEFWKIRDPDPSTEENEFKIEFEDRIDYANKWFGTWNPDRGKNTERRRYSKIGWYSDRGRIYIVLGPPDLLVFDMEDIRYDGRQSMKPEGVEYESWLYYKYDIVVWFQRTRSGGWIMPYTSGYLLYALEAAKLNMVMSEYEWNINRAFRFKSKFKNNTIQIRIPVERIIFDENLTAKFKIKVNIYCNHKKVDEIEDIQILNENEEELSRKNNVFLEIPYKPSLKGKYYFDIIVEDLLSPAFSKYINFAKFRFSRSSFGLSPSIITRPGKVF